ncbi:protein PHR1-LIKE 3-like isoform X1 [Triticum dicoccoides]|uniref:protein PHR1-LIKE 3-like isoform X1 n=2 Tax=Triticum dicoccoides TaxID=85692 RepID=UPI00188E3051|nr:protein PHR1-LIKE 3-like isoform X1 [Triticum dicoccoides]
MMHASFFFRKGDNPGFCIILMHTAILMMSNDKPTENSDSSYMSGILASCLLRAMQPTRSLLRWTDDLHKIFVEAVEYQGGPYEAKPTAVKQRMEAMGVTGLTIWNIKSHLQRYREKCNLGAESPPDVLSTASPSKGVDNVTSEAETVVDSDAAMDLTGMEMVSYLLMDDTEMADNAFSVDELQTMENELMNAIQA